MVKNEFRRFIILIMPILFTGKMGQIYFFRKWVLAVFNQEQFEE